MELIGYTDRFSVAAGEPLDVKVSCEAPAFDAQLVRLLHGDDHPEGPGFQERELLSPFAGAHRGRVQRAAAGSCIVVDPAPALDVAGFSFLVWAWPTLPAAGRRQVLAARGDRGWVLALDPDGWWELEVGEAVLRLPTPAGARRWARLAISHDLASGRVLLARFALEPEIGEARLEVAEGSAAARDDAGAPLVLAAAAVGPGARLADHYNGKLEAPRLLGWALGPEALDGDPGAPDMVAAWNLGYGADGNIAVDAGPHRLHGRVLNRPARAMTGHRWDGSATDFRQAPEQYEAISFHEDDLEDAGWDTDFVFDVPADLASGVYAVRLRAGGDEDHVPFVVRAPRDRATAKVALVIPTFTYMAYANHHVLRLKDEAWKYIGLPVRYDPLDELADRHPEWGRSLYDTHRDGSGCCISSRLRPIVNLRPRYRWWASGGAQYLASDLYIVHWLDAIAMPVDLVTDEDVHREGAELLARYPVVLTGTHPEYVTERMLDAFESHLAGGGRLMYLGGNGFYWVTSVPPTGTHVIEVRRGNAATRAWDSQPGEEHHAFTGERGGLWRHRGRPPNRLVGVGFSAQGWDDPSPGYHRTERSREPDLAWIFEGVDGDMIGDYGLAMNGAAGDELDRHDPVLGSPHAAVLASSRGHSRYYTAVHEDLRRTSPEVTGETNPLVRADLVYFETAAGGAVFSVGSKSWCASLSHDGYDNDIARITENVLRQFLAASGIAIH